LEGETNLQPNHLWSISLCNVIRLAEYIQERQIGYHLTVRLAIADQHGDFLPFYFLSELVEEARLADPGIPDDADNVPPSVLHPFQALMQKRSLLFPSYKPTPKTLLVQQGCPRWYNSLYAIDGKRGRQVLHSE
jgi:hypothetical protein